MESANQVLDELNPMSEARRYDGDGTGRCDLVVRHRYRTDSSNQRILKPLRGARTASPAAAIVALDSGRD